MELGSGNDEVGGCEYTSNIYCIGCWIMGLEKGVHDKIYL